MSSPAASSLLCAVPDTYCEAAASARSRSSHSAKGAAAPPKLLLPGGYIEHEVCCKAEQIQRPEDSIDKPAWTRTMAEDINARKSRWFRWHDSGDVQDEEHLLKIFAVAGLTPKVKHWMPTREAWVKAFLPLCPKNLVIRFSVPMVDQSRHKAPKEWRNTSTVSSDLNKTLIS